MEQNKNYNIDEFFVGELYLYTNFANFISESYNPLNRNYVNNFSKSGAICFQQDIISRYIDWEEKREYTGFLTIFYKQKDKYICLHDGNTYQLNGSNFIENLAPLSELLPKINTELITTITIPKALQLFNTLFKTTKDENKLYNEQKEAIKDFYVGDLTLRKIYHQENNPDSKYMYINLPHHIALDKSNLAIQSFSDSDYVSVIYRCLFLRKDLDLYNLNNYQFYNPNEDEIQIIDNLQKYLSDYGIPSHTESISIPKVLKLFRKTLY